MPSGLPAPPVFAGRFLEFAVPAPDLPASLAFYRALGFAEVATNDIRPQHYAAVTDGQLVIGLRGRGLDEPALTFVHRDLARHVRALVSAGVEPEFTQLADDQFNEAGLRTPDGQLLLLVEAPTFSGGELADVATPLVGTIAALLLPTRDAAAAQAYYAGLGCGPEGADQVACGSLRIQLAADWPVPAPALLLENRLSKATRGRLDDLGVTPLRRPVGEVLQAPEGTWLVLPR
jgi:catechol 2,3-dioxygenase-like lactoylglutathione lyase family enzyme